LFFLHNASIARGARKGEAEFSGKSQERNFGVYLGGERVM
jgi:hypothetical protein